MIGEKSNELCHGNSRPGPHYLKQSHVLKGFKLCYHCHQIEVRRNHNYMIQHGFRPSGQSTGQPDGVPEVHDNLVSQ